MKKSITVWALKGGIEGDLSVESAVEKVLAHGFDFLEPTFYEKNHVLSLTSTNKELQNLGSLLEEKHQYQVLSSLSTLLLDQYSLTSSDIETRKMARKIGLRMIEVAAILGIPSVSITPGHAWGDLTYPKCLSLSLEQMEHLGRRSRELGIDLCVENVWHGLLNSPLEFKYYIEQLNNENLGVCLDIGNCLRNGYAQHWAALLVDHIKKIHVTDLRKRKMGTLLEFVHPGQGNVDWKATFKELNKCTYPLTYTVEAFASRRLEDNILLDQIKNSLKELDKVKRGIHDENSHSITSSR